MKFVNRRRFDEEAHRRNASVPPDALTILLADNGQWMYASYTRQLSVAEMVDYKLERVDVTL